MGYVFIKEKKIKHFMFIVLYIDTRYVYLLKIVENTHFDLNPGVCFMELQIKLGFCYYIFMVIKIAESESSFHSLCGVITVYLLL